MNAQEISDSQVERILRPIDRACKTRATQPIERHPKSVVAWISFLRNSGQNPGLSKKLNPGYDLESRLPVLSC
jgi:hypothetical protein